ncbi:hypothetical protein B4U79_11287 [Dinothrombium tinctorium]|uniref:Complex 1 LYR protein domain-containing protein n=1 Tax=Dinothrombium tinctorium TaxID=1965070 RepID=A0A443R062_9ACAR|nr:hypothetical protein B4U79_06613 [Dinothrombium tinctorium]RWS10535.1 hypothetical protein B4U79_11287 [Dinothrombium tinctorium]
MSPNVQKSALTLRQVRFFSSSCYLVIIHSTQQFLLRQRTLQLYKTFLKTIAAIKDEKQKKETLKWIREEFKANTHHKEEVALSLFEFTFY